MVTRRRLRLLTALLSTGVAFGEQIQLVPADLKSEATILSVEVVDARPEWQKEKKILSLWRTSCDFAIVRWGDSDTTPSRAQAIALWLGKYQPPAISESKVKLVWFTLHTNRRAPPSVGYDPREPGIVYGALHALECRGGSEIIGGVDKEEVSSPAPLVVDIVLEIAGRSYSGRAVGSVPDTTVASAKLVGEAIERLTQSIRVGSSPPTPCDRLKAAMNASPKVAFYGKSYDQYCGSKE